MKVLLATAMYPSPARPTFGTFVKTQLESLQHIGVDVQPYVLDGPSRKAMYATAAAGLRRRLDDERGFDVLHAHYGLVGLVARFQRKVPLVVTFHGDDLLGTVNARGRTTVPSRVIRSAVKRLARHAQGVIVQNAHMADVLGNAPNVHVVPHEVDLDLFRPTEACAARAALGLDPHERYVLFAANPEIAVKRYPLAEAAVEVARIKHPRTTLLVVHAETQERLALYMSAADALIFPSFQEGSPNIVKQAMACNLPIVSTDVGDVREVVGGTAGCHVVAANAATLGAALTKVLATRQRTDGRRAVEHLRCDLVAHRVLKVYEAAVAEGRR